MVQSLVSIPERELRGEERKLYTRVRRTLWDYEPLRASHALIVIGIDGRRVHLSGRVRTLPQKIMAEVLVGRMDDVELVANDLVADAEVVRAVADALAEDERTAPYILLVDARHGFVSLSGQVPDEATRAAALEIASRVPVVEAVQDHLVVGGATYQGWALTRRSGVPPGVSPERALAYEAATEPHTELAREQPPDERASR